MILSQLLHAFPGCHFSTRAVADSWEVCVLHGALQPGMREWCDLRNLRAQRATGVDGYVISWRSNGPEGQRRAFETVKKFAHLGVLAARQRHMYNDSALRGFDKHINDFILSAKEIGL